MELEMHPHGQNRFLECARSLNPLPCGSFLAVVVKWLDDASIPDYIAYRGTQWYLASVEPFIRLSYLGLWTEIVLAETTLLWAIFSIAQWIRRIAFGLEHHDSSSNLVGRAASSRRVSRT